MKIQAKILSRRRLSRLRWLRFSSLASQEERCYRGEEAARIQEEFPNLESDSEIPRGSRRLSRISKKMPHVERKWREIEETFLDSERKVPHQEAKCAERILKESDFPT
ncbi:hypothetical protein VNO77_20076 [Canavalia gladiata]|uniref:Uncharacterized protein n=1 Tax=Canavalia gladiata TaxID=3824 RepID=A0AAN9QM34_CANGL